MNTPSQPLAIKLEDRSSVNSDSDTGHESTAVESNSSVDGSESDESSDSDPSDSTRELQKFYGRTFHQRSRDHGSKLLTLDPIRKELVGKLEVKSLLHAGLSAGGPEWI